MITMACFGTQWLAGEKKVDHGVTYLDNAFIYVIQGNQHGFVFLPGKPTRIDISNALFTYNIETEEILALYKKQLDNSKIQDAVIITEPNIIRPA